MKKIYNKIPEKLAYDIIFALGNTSPNGKQLQLMQELLSYTKINPIIQEKNMLSEQEKICLFWMAHGKSFAETAELMNITKNTVATYIKRVKEKLKSKTVAQSIFMTMCYQQNSSTF